MKINFNWKVIAETVGLLITIIALVAASHYYSLYKSVKESKDLIITSKNDLKVPISPHVDTAGRHHIQAPANTNTYSRTTIKENPNVSLGGVDTTVKILAIQRDQIEYWKELALTIAAKNLKAQSKYDSLGRLVRYYKDKYVSIAYHYPSVLDTTDKGTFDYSQNLVVTGTQYFKKKFLWVRYNPIVDIYPDDPHATINSLRSLTITPNPSPFSFKAGIKGIYDFKSHSITPLLQAQFGVGNFDLGGGYYYNTKLQEARPVLSAAYNFVNIR